MLGHSYFYVLREEIADAMDKEGLISMVWKQEILPQLIDNLISSNQLMLCERLNQCLNPLGFVLQKVGSGLHEMLCVEPIPKGKEQEAPKASPENTKQTTP